MHNVSAMSFKCTPLVYKNHKCKRQINAKDL